MIILAFINISKLFNYCREFGQSVSWRKVIYHFFLISEINPLHVRDNVKKQNCVHHLSSRKYIELETMYKEIKINVTKTRKSR